jgi:signal transduction histidine kinase
MDDLLVDNNSVSDQSQSVSIENDMNTIEFTVDSKLLMELGERLVGRPHIALAELVKNSYDADATRVLIRLLENSIAVIDNGHGMDFSEFQKFWMRVGSHHKEDQVRSRYFGRPITGSKGVGRLSVQFLARRLQMRTVSKRDLDTELEVHVNWSEAVEAGELTKATAQYRTVPATTRFPGNKRHGTAIVLTTLNQEWTPNNIEELAKELWPLQPPFQKMGGVAAEDEANVFDVKLEGPDPGVIRRFENHMEAILDIWTARISGRLHIQSTENSDDKIELVVEFSDGEEIRHEFSVDGADLIHFIRFEIRVYTLKHRQPYGIKVGDARDYFKEFGGVHVYDGGFRLPYYGTPESDWLEILSDHASRRRKSGYLPDGMQVGRGMQYVPNLSRTFGVVHVNTALEQRRALEEGQRDYLKIQVSRDRLVDNQSFQGLKNIIRYAIDFYANEEARRKLNDLEAQRPIERPQDKLERVDEALHRYKQDIPAEVYTSLQTEVKDAIRASEVETELLSMQAGLLGTLATAGMAALAHSHEAQKLDTELWEIANRLERLDTDDPQLGEQLEAITQRLYDWRHRSKASRALFESLLIEENRTFQERFKARVLVKEVANRLGMLMRGIKPRTFRLEESLRLPKASYAEWVSIFQNVFLNAVNAMLDSSERILDVSSRYHDNRREIWIQDTGSGVDLETSDELFKPFVRKLEISPERRSLGAGGSGLGLTIAKMIADSIGCELMFVSPENGFSTAFCIRWKEK